MLKNLNYPAAFTLILYPIFIIFCTVAYIIDQGFGWLEFWLLFSGYYVAHISVGIGLHRLWSHNTYKINKYAEFALVLISAGTLQGPALSWASNHFKHHTYTDKDGDPHSPLKYNNRVLGFLWSHIGWMLKGEGSYKSIDRVTMIKLGKNKLLRWQLKYYWQIALVMNLILPPMVGYAFGQTLTAALAGFIFIGLGRAIQQQITFFVNSLCHFAGSKKYASDSTAGDVWWLALLLLGENWHNYHHAFPNDYRNGIKWYHFDVHKWIIYILSKCGLASDLKTTQPVRVQAKASQTIKDLLELRKTHISNLQAKARQISCKYQQALAEIEDSTAIMKKKFWKNIHRSMNKLNYLQIQLSRASSNIEKTSERLILVTQQQLAMLENIVEDALAKCQPYS